MDGFFGQLLRIDLTTGSISVEPIEEQVFHDYLGGKGLGTYLLLREIPGDVDPLSPANKLIFVTGQASDTGHPAASRYGVISKSPQTGIYAESYSGGHVAPVMKGTGYDAVIIQGASTEPVYLVITEDGVRLENAASLWGLESYEAEDRIKAQAGLKNAQALVIGPAGERLVRFACIKNNYWRSAGRTGMGTVMGSKKLKGIVFSGKRKAAVHDPERVKALIKDLRRIGRDSGGVKAYFNYGTPMMVSMLNEVHSFPTRYWKQGRSPWVNTLSAEYMNDQMKVKSRACKGCFIACGKLTEVLQGKYRGLTIEGPEYETIYALGGLCCLETLEEVVYLNDLCDRLGIDTMTAGNLAALTIEAGLQGRISGAPGYGDAEGIAKLIHSIVKREGLGAVLAEGIKTAASRWGMSDQAIHVKGMEPAGYDPRVLKGMGLAYATSDRGACHLRATFYKPELSGIIDPKQIKGKAELFVDYEDRLAIFDTFIFCRFYRDLLEWEALQELIEAFTGRAYARGELKDMANRIITLTRTFNLSCGITRADDTLPPRFFKEPLGEHGEHSINREELDQMVSEYYALRGWDEKGVPPPGGGSG